MAGQKDRAYWDDPTALRRVDEDEPGITRRRRKDGFSYFRADGRVVKDGATLKRIEVLAVPPAWEHVWICATKDGHIQATGRDVAGRKQYLYHPLWRAARESDKFVHLDAFARRLPDLREAVRADLAGEGLEERRVVAAVVRALETTFGRVGSERYAASNGSYGLSTLLEHHVEERNSRRVRFVFPAKGGKEVELEVEDGRVADVVARCMELPGDRLFQYIDEEGEIGAVRRGAVNDYIRAVAGDGFSAKHFRTWAATVLMTETVREAGARPTDEEREDVLREAVCVVADHLANTPDVCRKSYIHPAVAAAYLDGSFEERLRHEVVVPDGLWPEERRTLRLLASFR